MIDRAMAAGASPQLTASVVSLADAKKILRSGGSITTSSVRTALWAIGHRRKLPNRQCHKSEYSFFEWINFWVRVKGSAQIESGSIFRRVQMGGEVNIREDHCSNREF